MNILKKPGFKLAVGLAGLIFTNVLTAKCTVKYIKKKEELDHEPTKEESLKIIATCFGPVLASVAGTAFVIFKSASEYKGQTREVAKDYNGVIYELNKYKKALGLDQVVTDICSSQTEEKKGISWGTIKVKDPDSDIFFECYPEQLGDAKYEYIRAIEKCTFADDIVPWNIWREVVGCPVDLKGESLGYSQSYCMECGGSSGIDIGEELVLENGDQYYIITRSLPPIYGNSHQNHWL